MVHQLKSLKIGNDVPKFGFSSLKNAQEKYKSFLNYEKFSYFHLFIFFSLSMNGYVLRIFPLNQHTFLNTL